MQNILPILLTLSITGLGAYLLYRRGMNASPASYAMAVNSVTAVSPSDVSQQLIDLRRLISLGTVTVDAAALHLSGVWGVSRTEAKEILVREL
jgi:hypothetical protein